MKKTLAARKRLMGFFLASILLGGVAVTVGVPLVRQFVAQQRSHSALLVEILNRLEQSKHRLEVFERQSGEMAKSLVQSNDHLEQVKKQNDLIAKNTVQSIDRLEALENQTRNALETQTQKFAELMEQSKRRLEVLESQSGEMAKSLAQSNDHLEQVKKQNDLITKNTVQSNDRLEALENQNRDVLTVVKVINGALARAPLVLPPVLYGVVGQETNLYFDNILLSDYKSYDFQFVGAINGKMRQFDDRLQWIPDGVFDGELVLKVLDKQTGVTVASQLLRLRSSLARSLPNTVALFIGDSLVSSGIITQTLLDHAKSIGMTLTLEGTQGIGKNRYEAQGGWTVRDYTGPGRPTAPNPFWRNGALDFVGYLRANRFPVPNWVFIHLGINDIFGAQSDEAAVEMASNEFKRLNELILHILSIGPEIRIGLILPSPPSYHQDSFALSEAFGYTRARAKRNILLWTQEEMKYASMLSQRVFLVPSNLNLDTQNNMQQANPLRVNSRSEVAQIRQSNSVHPSPSGYRQIGDGVWYFLSSVLK